jgi:rod shape-determining protein MreC
LAAENVRLNQLVTALQQQKGLADTAEAIYQPDSVFAARFEYRVAKVIDNSTHLANNYLTIDKGTADGIKPGMGVISATGIVGKVRYCSEHFSVITSILHTQFLVSSRLIRSNEMGTAKWDGADPEQINLNDVSRYKKVLKGDTAVTSDYNAVFPPNVNVGMVEGVKIRPDQTFYDIRLRLATDFRNLRYVYVVSNRLIEEQEALQKRVEEAP